MHTVAVVTLPDVVAFDLSTPIEVFGRALVANGPAYRVIVCGTESVVPAGPLRIGVDHDLDDLRTAHTVVVPGRNDPTAPVPEALLDALRAAYARGARVTSICSGAFTLAAAGLLDGRRATTHWMGADVFRAMYPAVELDPEVLYVDEGRIVTSAGASAGLDMCLYLVARDHGTAVAAHAARLAVAPLHRSGGQAQFIVRNEISAEMAGRRTDLADVLTWIEREAHRDLMLREIADVAAVSIRTLNRWFQTETGQTPMQWVTGVRIRHAQQLLETTDLGVETIGRKVGFTSAANFRDQFRRLSGVAPRTYRDTFRERLAG